MSAETTTIIVQKAYPDHDVIEYLGLHNQKRCFGLLHKDLFQTIDAPFYVLVDQDEVEQIDMPVFADDAYESSQFATIERKFRFFETKNIIE